MGGVSTFGYVLQRPLKLSDPKGLKPRVDSFCIPDVACESWCDDAKLKCQQWTEFKGGTVVLIGATAGAGAGAAFGCGAGGVVGWTLGTGIVALIGQAWYQPVWSNECDKNFNECMGSCKPTCLMNSR